MGGQTRSKAAGSSLGVRRFRTPVMKSNSPDRHACLQCEHARACTVASFWHFELPLIPRCPRQCSRTFFFLLPLDLKFGTTQSTANCTRRLSAQLLVKSHHPRRQRVMALLPWYVHSSQPVTDTSMLWHLAEDLCLSHWREQPAFLITFISALTCMMKSREQTQTSKTRL